jgi:hypothetical protein
MKIAKPIWIVMISDPHDEQQDVLARAWTENEAMGYALRKAEEEWELSPREIYVDGVRGPFIDPSTTRLLVEADGRRSLVECSSLMACPEKLPEGALLLDLLTLFLGPDGSKTQNKTD